MFHPQASYLQHQEFWGFWETHTFPVPHVRRPPLFAYPEPPPQPQLARSELLDRVENFLATQPLTDSLATRIKNYYGYVTRRRFNDRDDQELVASLPSDLRRAVLQAMHSQLVKRVPFLREAAVYHEALVLEITAALKLEFFSKGDCVVSEGGWDTELYFVTEGILHVRQYVADSHAGPADIAGGLGNTPTRDDPGLKIAAAAAPPPQAGVIAASGVKAAAPVIPTTTAGDGDGDGDGDDEDTPRNGPAGASSRSRGGGSGGEIAGNPTGSHRKVSIVRRWLAATAGGGIQAHSSPGDVVLEMYSGNTVSARAATRDDAEGRPVTTAATSQPLPRPPPAELEAVSADGREPRFVTRSGSGLESFSPSFNAQDPGIRVGGGGVGGGGFGGGSFAVEELHPAMSPVPQGKSRSLYDSNVRSKRLKELKEGHYFGEYGCLTGCPRTATVIAVQMCEVYCLKRSDLKAAMSKWPGLEAAWKRCEEYGTRERGRLRLHLQADHAPRSLSLMAVEDPYDNRLHDSAVKAVCNSQKRYQDFLDHFGGAAGIIATEPSRVAAAAVAVAATARRDRVSSESGLVDAPAAH
ncbi:hypothetical protein Vretifemale_7549 [Volvox reticuliferus]|nr:hypothetical protein Vretifemale_7549 [Volvox reticuliferus]